MKATPITSALKRKYSPFKETAEEKLNKETEEKSVIVTTPEGKAERQTTYTKKGQPGTTETKKRLTWNEAWNQNLEGIQGKYKSKEDYIADRKGQKAKDTGAYEKDMVAKTGVEGGPGTKTITTGGTPDEIKTKKEKLYSEVIGTGKEAWESRDTIRGAKQAARKQKQATVRGARAQAKLDKLPPKERRAAIKEARNKAKVAQAESVGATAGAEAENFKRMAEEGAKAGEKFYKTQRLMDAAEAQKLGNTQASDTEANNGNNDSDNNKKKTDGTLPMRYDMGKFRKVSTKAPLKKLTDLSGDGKITKKDVLIGRGVISKDGSPTKYGNKKTPFKMGGFGSKKY
jgi:hypothetical protein